MTKDIFCFHVDVGNENLNATVPLWVSIWAKHGWSPHVLGMEDAKLHPDFQQVYDRAEAMPTANFRAFSTVNFVRWCAFAMVDGAVADYDVLPRVASYPPQDYPGFTCGDVLGGPGFIVGTKSDFSKVIEVFLQYRKKHYFNGVPHICDMTVLQNSSFIYDSIDWLIACYGASGWQKVPLVHFGNGYMKHAGTLSKADEIKQVLQAEGTVYE